MELVSYALTEPSRLPLLYLLTLVSFLLGPPPRRLSPDELDAGHAFTHKRDIWHLGVTVLRMLWGSDVIYRYPDLEAILSTGQSPS